MSARSEPVLDEALLERLFAKLEKPIYNVVYRWLWNEDEADDVTQEAFLRLWKMRERVDAATVEPLVYRIAVNLAANRRRSKKLWKWLSFEGVEEPPASGDLEGAMIDRERERGVRKAIEALPESLRRVIMLSEFSELSYKEIAVALSIPEGTVGSRRNKALRLLRQDLEPMMENGSHAT